MITRMQVEMAKSLYDQAHRSAELAHAGWLVRKKLYRFMFPLASEEQFAKIMSVPNTHYEQAVEVMQKLREEYKALAAQLDEK